MYVRIARFEGGNASEVGEVVKQTRAELQEAREGRADSRGKGVRRVLVVFDRDGGKGAGLTFCESEEEMRQADEMLNEMSPPPGSSGRRVSVDIYEVMLDENL
jgi:hypothetical protein